MLPMSDDDFQRYKDVKNDIISFRVRAPGVFPFMSIDNHLDDIEQQLLLFLSRKINIPKDMRSKFGLHRNLGNLFNRTGFPV